MAASSAAKKLTTDLKKLEKDPPPGVSACPTENDLLYWDAVIFGPHDTPFEGGIFKLKLKFPHNYPSQAPTVWFYSKMFHPNVYRDGKICLDILEETDKWDSNYDVAAVLCSIQSMLGDPNPNSPANGEANGLFLRQPEEYVKRVAEIVLLSGQTIDQDDEYKGSCEEMINENQLELQEAGEGEDQIDEDMLYALSIHESLEPPNQIPK